MLNVKEGQKILVKLYGKEQSYEAIVTKVYKHCFKADGIKFVLQPKMAAILVANDGKQFYAALDAGRYVIA